MAHYVLTVICEESIIIFSFGKLKLRDLLKIGRLLVAEVGLQQPSTARGKDTWAIFFSHVLHRLYTKELSRLGRDTYDRWISGWKDGGTDG